jgi:putative transcriptional regulator
MTGGIVGNKVRRVRLAMGLTQQQLAEMSDLARQSIISIEKGRFTPTIETALKLARALESPLESLFWLEDGDR